MIYQYHCEKCDTHFDVVKSVKDMEVNETCRKCGEFAIREFVPRATYLIGTKVEHPEYNPGLGQVVRNKQHKREICKARGLEEIGNEKVETVHKVFDKAREEAHEKSWADADAGWVGNGDIGA